MKRIRKEMPGAMLNCIDAAAGVWQNNYDTIGTPGNLIGWTQVQMTSGPRFFRQDTLDINGVTNLMEKALMPISIETQQAEFYRAGGLAAPVNEPDCYAVEYVMLTTVPFDADAWIRENTGVTTDPGKLPTIFGTVAVPQTNVLSAGQCLYGRFRYLQNDAHTFERVALVKGESFFGALEPTMADELYLTRIITWNGTLQVGAKLEVPDIQMHILCTTDEMSDLSQIMELRRSYLTQQTI